MTDAPLHVDISAVVQNAQQLDSLLTPVSKVLKVAQKLQRWEAPTVNIVLLASINLICLIIPGVTLLMLLLFGIGALITAAVTHQRTDFLFKIIPRKGAEDQATFQSHQDLMNQYKNWLCQMDTVMSHIIDTIDNIYLIITCEDTKNAIRFYLPLTIWTICFCLLSPPMCLAMLVNLMFLDHKIQPCIELVVTRLKKSSLQGQQETFPLEMDPVSESSQDNTGLLSSNASSGVDLTELDKTSLSDSDSEDTLETPVHMSHVDGGSNQSQNHVVASSSHSQPVPQAAAGPSSENPAVSTNHVHVEKAATGTQASKSTGVVGKLLDLKRKHSNPAGTCKGCRVPFTSILKRRHLCTCCGNAFCSRCCNHKVPKSLFGVTAPSAQSDMVAVCGPCYIELNR